MTAVGQRVGQIGRASIAGVEGVAADAFGRLRVSEPTTLFDSKNIFNDPDLADSVENLPIFYDNAQVSGGGTSTTYDAGEASQTLLVSADTAGRRVRQTRMRFNYQPGKSQLVFMTFNLHGPVAGITKREGIFDDSNGIFLETAGTATRLVIRSSATGEVVDTVAEQADWNLATMPALDLTKVQILVIDFEWLGVGRVRVGFVVDGSVRYVHAFRHANLAPRVYMSTPNLPLRSEIANGGEGPAATITQICSTVISEGGSQDLGALRHASTATAVVMADTATWYAVLGIQLRPAYLGAAIKLISTALQVQTATKKIEWALAFDPVVAGTFTYAPEAQSAVAIARGATANTVTGGYVFAGGFLETGGVASGAAASTAAGIANARLLGSSIAGAPDSIVLMARPIAGDTSVSVVGALTWREMT